MIQSKRPTETQGIGFRAVDATISVPEISTLRGWAARGVADREFSFVVPGSEILHRTANTVGERCGKTGVGNRDIIVLLNGAGQTLGM